MIIGFDVSQTGAGKAGCGHLADALITTLVRLSGDDSFVLYPVFGTGFWDPGHARATRMFDTPRVSRRLAGLTHAESLRFWNAPPADFEAQLGSPDVIHSNNFFCPLGLRHARLVYTLYDLVAFDHCEATTEANRRTCCGGIVAASLHADLLLAISEATRRRFMELFPHYPAERVKVVHPASRFGPDGPAPRDERPLPGLTSGGFWLCVGTLEPRKNLRRVLAAFARLPAVARSGRPLVVVGGAGWMEDGLGDVVGTLGVGGQVRFTGYVSDAELRWLYRECFAFLYPSLAEGFGLPVVEALGLGAAVVTSDTSSLPEAAGEAALLVPPQDEDALHAVLRRLLDERGLRAALRERAAAQAARFTWEGAARAVRAAYDEVRAREPFTASAPRLPAVAG